MLQQEELACKLVLHIHLPSVIVVAVIPTLAVVLCQFSQLLLSGRWPGRVGYGGMEVGDELHTSNIPHITRIQQAQTLPGSHLQQHSMLTVRSRQSGSLICRRTHLCREWNNVATMMIAAKGTDPRRLALTMPPTSSTMVTPPGQPRHAPGGASLLGAWPVWPLIDLKIAATLPLANHAYNKGLVAILPLALAERVLWMHRPTSTPHTLAKVAWHTKEHIVAAAACAAAILGHLRCVFGCA